MTTMNVIGGTLGVIALGSIFFLHGCDKKPVESMPVAKIETPVNPYEPAVPIPTPPNQMPAQCTVEHPCHTVIQSGPAKKPVYNRVLKGGRIGAPINCKTVPLAAKVASPDDVMKAAKEYGLTPAQLAQLRVCLN